MLSNLLQTTGTRTKATYSSKRWSSYLWIILRRCPLEQQDDGVRRVPSKRTLHRLFMIKIIKNNICTNGLDKLCRHAIDMDGSRRVS